MSEILTAPAEQNIRQARPNAYLKGVNSIRGILVFPVVFTHIIIHLDEFGLNPFIIGKNIDGSARVLDVARFGMGIFFAISGFLITYLLRLEKDKRGSVNIKQFYIRRALRLFPLYYAQIAFTLVLYHIYDIAYTNWDLMIYSCYAVNIPYVFSGQLPLLGHYWTLSMEEQFYFTWPWFQPFSNRQLLRFCWLMLLLFFIARALMNQINAFSDFFLLKLMNYVWFQCMLIGCIFGLYYLEYREQLIKLSENIVIQFITYALLILGAFNLLRDHLPFYYELTTIAGCMLMVNQNSTKLLINLENKLFNYVGKISYPVYIVHNAMIFLCAKLVSWETVSNKPLRYILVTLLVFSTSFLMAQLAHVFIEKPFLKLKEKKFTFIHGLRS